MMIKDLPPLKYHYLKDVAKQWGCSEEDLLKYAEQGLLTIVVRTTPKAEGYKNGDFVTHYEDDYFSLDSEAIQTILNPDHLFSKLSESFANKRKHKIWADGKQDEGYGDIDYWVVEYRPSEMFITHDEKVRFENKRYENIPLLSKENVDSMPEKLQIAIKAWAYLYDDGNINDKQGHSEQIIDFLERNYPLLSKAARECIATVIIADSRKKGGVLLLKKGREE